MNPELFNKLPLTLPAYCAFIKNYNGYTKHMHHYLKNGIAYTEDHIPVQLLLLFEISNELKKEDLLEYFTKNHGKMLNMEIHSPDEIVNAIGRLSLDKGKSQMKVGFALFAHVHDAAKVLLKSKHKVKGSQTFCVQPHFSWLQPEANELPQELESQPAAILNLNDDCLEQVLEYLSLADQIHLARTCLRFRRIYQRVSARLHKTLRLSYNTFLTVCDIRDFCILSGSFVKHMRIFVGESSWQIICFPLGNYFPNLKILDLKFNSDRLAMADLHKSLIGLNLLEELKLCIWGNDKNIGPSLKHLKTLKKLKLAFCNLDELEVSTSVESFSFVRCYNEDRYLPKMFEIQKQVKELDLYEMEGPANMYKEMIKWPSCASLEVLGIVMLDGYDDYELIAQLPNLKHLFIRGKGLRTELFTQLAKHKSQQLEHLEVDEKQDMSTGILLEIAKLTELRTLDLKMDNSMDDRIISELGKLSNLESIYLRPNNFSDDAVLQLLFKCPKLYDLKYSFDLSQSLYERIIKQIVQEIKNGNNQRKLPIKWGNGGNITKPNFSFNHIIEFCYLDEYENY